MSRRSLLAWLHVAVLLALVSNVPALAMQPAVRTVLEGGEDWGTLLRYDLGDPGVGGPAGHGALRRRWLRQRGQAWRVGLGDSRPERRSGDLP